MIRTSLRPLATRTLETASKPATAPLKPFPDSPRVVYKTNTLEETICQLKFPPILRIESEAPATFQDQISADYPVLQEGPVSLQAILPPAIASMLASQLVGLGTREFQFISADGTWKVVLNREFIALSATRYTHWEEFSSRLRKVFSALESQYKPPTFLTRVGLRYRNTIKRSEFGSQNEPWTRLLAPHILGELSDAAVAPGITQATRQTVISLDDRGNQVRLNHGLAASPQAGEICYSIDIDLFNEARTEVADVFDRLKLFNRQAGRLFRWCITEHLHNALGPDVVV
jgi:uncharacterized protein (TIGR04255 family)